MQDLFRSSSPTDLQQRHTLFVDPGALEVFGYLGHTLTEITNTSGRAIEVALSLERDTLEHVSFDAGEILPVNVDAWACIRDRCMPYIISKETETVRIELTWRLSAPDNHEPS